MVVPLTLVPSLISTVACRPLPLPPFRLHEERITDTKKSETSCFFMRELSVTKVRSGIRDFHFGHRLRLVYHPYTAIEWSTPGGLQKLWMSSRASSTDSETSTHRH